MPETSQSVCAPIRSEMNVMSSLRIKSIRLWSFQGLYEISLHDGKAKVLPLPNELISSAFLIGLYSIFSFPLSRLLSKCSKWDSSQSDDKHWLSFSTRHALKCPLRLSLWSSVKSTINENPERLFSASLCLIEAARFSFVARKVRVALMMNQVLMDSTDRWYQLGGRILAQPFSL